MNIFKGFNNSNGVVCPVCKTNKNVETVLIPIEGTEDGGNVEARQMHKKCYDLITEMSDTTPSLPAKVSNKQAVLCVLCGAVWQDEHDAAFCSCLEL